MLIFIYENTRIKKRNSLIIDCNFEKSVSIDQSWNGNYVTSGNSISIQPLDYNQKIEAGQSVDVGLIIKAGQEQKTPKVSLK